MTNSKSVTQDYNEELERELKTDIYACIKEASLEERREIADEWARQFTGNF